ncbi:MAG: hypothetical protein KAR32_10480 [Candidatus Omnitrophica bacterium]|nr:hypothetical protein [Candidatus Omnitrophota bacterium]
MKLLIHAINGIGLGHVIRTGRIAEALKKLRPDGKIVFATNTKYSAILKESYKTYILRKDTREVIEGRYSYEEYLRYNEMAIRKIISHERPDAVLFDCELNKELVFFCRKNSIKTVYVLRITTPKRFSDIKKYLDLFELVIVPHEEEGFPSDQKDLLLSLSAVFVGPIIDLRDCPKGSVRKNVLITFGSGARIPENAPLYTAVDSFLAFLRKNDSMIGPHRVDVDIVTGPFYEGGCDLRGFTTRPTSDSLVEDMHRSRIVVSGAGYNTINEIIGTKTPAVVIPLSRRWDDQFQRAENLGWLGCIKVAQKDILGPMRDILENWQDYHEKFPPIKSGNAHVARILSEALGQKI